MPDIVTTIAIIVASLIGFLIQYLVIKSAVGAALSEHRKTVLQEEKLAATRAKYTGPQAE